MKYVLLFIIVYGLFILLMAKDKDPKGSDYLIILGCRLDDDKPTKTLVSRIDRAVSYLKDNPQCKAVVSGGITEGNTISEAQVMERLLIERGIDRSRIIKEEKAQDTFENFFYSKELIDKDSKICFCSSDYHIFRSRLMADKNDLKIHNICSRSSLWELLYHLLLEEFFIIHNLLKR